MSLLRVTPAFATIAFLACAAVARAQSTSNGVVQSAPDSGLRMVVVVMRHGVRSPTSETEMLPYVAYPLPKWEVPPGYLTPNGASLMTIFGAAYRAQYEPAGLLPAFGCPKHDSVYVWADVDERTLATGAALLAGVAPKCNLDVENTGAAVDPLFHALPTVGTADPIKAGASVAGYLAGDPAALIDAHALEFKKLDDLLGCENSACVRISHVPMKLRSSTKTGLSAFDGAVDLASTAVEDFLLAYADGKPLSDIGRGAVDAPTLLELAGLHTLKFAINTEPVYIATAQGSNLLAHVAATIDQGATGTHNAKTRVPLAARFVAFVGHDTNLEEFAGMLNLRWLVPGYQMNDTPPGGALVFEVRQSSVAGTMPFVRTFFETQTLDEMRSLSKAPPLRVPVYVPGCPDFDCPIATFDRIVNSAIDPAFVGSW